MNSLERSLQAGLVISLMVLSLLFWWAGSLVSRQLAESLVVARLQAEASLLSERIRIEAGQIEVPEPDDARLPADLIHPGSGRFFMVRGRGSLRVTSASAGDLRLRIPLLVPGQQRRLRSAGGSEEPLLLWLGGYSLQGQGFTLALGEDVSPIESRLRVFQWFFAASSVLLLLALVSVQRLIIRGSMRRLDRIRQDIIRLEHGQAVELSEEVPVEIRPLVKEFNRLLIRFDRRLQQSRNALGNLAHTLKGPLSVLLRASEADDADSTTGRREIAQNAERIHQLIDSELKRARLAGRSSVGQLFDLDAELPNLVGLLRQVYSEKAVDIRLLVSADVALYHDRQDMLELIGNLLDNAVKWADSVVMVQVRRVRGVIIEVEDDGPGCSSSDLERLTGRGVRLDESVAGHGLGLSIVKDIVEIYDGRLVFERSRRLGGLRASVFLPEVQQRT